LDNLTFIGAIILGAVVVLGVIVFFMTQLYKRASKEMAFVRTGMGGQKVVKDGGALILPVFHETVDINMQTLRLTVDRKAKDSLITKDRLRVDVKAEFYVRVSPDLESIAAAAQTLGKRTTNPQQLAELIEGKFVDVLRAVAAGMDMQDLHEKRADFVKQVQTTAAEDLKKNGLELESVSLTGLDQTSVEHFNPNNAFDAEGLAKLTSVTETRRKERNEIEADNRVAIEQKNFEANKRSLEIKQQDEFATLEQERQVETQRAEQAASLAKIRAERTREADIAEIEANQATEAARVEQKRRIQVAETEAAQALEIAAQASRIAVAQKSEEESTARAKADEARATAVAAAEAVKTVEAEARAQRDQKVAVIAAETKAQEEAAGIRIRAEAELAAADASAKAKERLVEADARRYEVEAEGQRALNEAANLMSPEQAALQIRLKLIDKLPEILEQMGKPIEKIDSFRVVHMNGGIGGGRTFGGEEGETSGNGGNGLPGQMTDALLGYRLQAPFVDELAKELGIDLSKGMSGVVDGLSAPITGNGDAPVAKAVPAPKPRRVRDEPLPADEREELQRLAGIHPDAE
jgi:uncharacterized membrane protein YqiK